MFIIALYISLFHHQSSMFVHRLDFIKNYEIESVKWSILFICDPSVIILTTFFDDLEKKT